MSLTLLQRERTAPSQLTVKDLLSEVTHVETHSERLHAFHITKSPKNKQLMED